MRHLEIRRIIPGAPRISTTRNFSGDKGYAQSDFRHSWTPINNFECATSFRPLCAND
jgi:hypothetical protein